MPGSPQGRVRRARNVLAGSVLLSAMLWAVAAGATVLILVMAADGVASLPRSARVVAVPAAVLAAIAAAGVVMWRGRRARSVTAVALWLEEREAMEDYVLVTALESRLPEDSRQALHAAVQRRDIEGHVRRGWRRPLARALSAALLAAGIAAALDPRQLLSAATSRGGGRSGKDGPMPNRLSPLGARIVPPAYARLRDAAVQNPRAVAALVGSRIVFSGRGPASGITGELHNDTIAATEAEQGWGVQVTMPKDPVALLLRDRTYHHVVVLEPVPDSAPVLRLELPATDTTFQQVPATSLQIRVTIEDDIGLDSGHVELVLSSGSGENFDVRRRLTARTRFGNDRRATLTTTIRLDTLKLSPGSVLHIRAVAWDGNTVAPRPGMGTSDTRTLRIAEKLDSTSIVPVPALPIDSMLISQRLLNMRTDTLVRAKGRLPRADFESRSTIHGNTQDDIRKRAEAVIGLLEEDASGGTFQTETSAKLRVVATLMWDARSLLGVAEPETAMPIMIRILGLLDEIRLAHRYYLRGLIASAPVNIERARLTSPDPADAAVRVPRERLSQARRELAMRLSGAAALLVTQRASALDSLAYIRVSAMSVAPDVAASLRRVIEVIEAGGAAEAELAKARRALLPAARIMTGAPTWGGLP